jgi:hypothetical protein
MQRYLSDEPDEQPLPELVPAYLDLFEAVMHLSRGAHAAMALPPPRSLDLRASLPCDPPLLDTVWAACM